PCRCLHNPRPARLMARPLLKWNPGSKPRAGGLVSVPRRVFLSNAPGGTGLPGSRCRNPMELRNGARILVFPFRASPARTAGTWRRDFLAKEKAGLDVSLELEEGRQLFMEMRGTSRDVAPPLAAVGPPDRGTLLADETLGFARNAFQRDLKRSRSFPLCADRP